MSRDSHKNRIEKRANLFKHQKGICGYCHKPIKDKPSLDHIIPIVLGGDNSIENSIVCCKNCNYHKHDYIVFSSVYDKMVYPIIDVPFFFRVKEIVSNGHKENKRGR